ncbi:hypothetical protein FI667_g14384, partial [Globisporangium splendens]
MVPNTQVAAPNRKCTSPRETPRVDEGVHMTTTRPSTSSYSTTGTARRCGFPECAKTAKPGGFCISHGGGKKCSVEGCTTSVVSRGCCVAHGGGKRCQRPECTKSAQTGGFCWIHGGGKKCGFQGCVKRAQSGGACISHGGGKRCRMPECNKVVQYDGLCVGHGGYRKCLSMNCAKKALANSYCANHGGNSQCAIETCIRKATKGRFCSEHKGGVVVTPPVQHHGAASNETTMRGLAHSSIEPTATKQQQNTYLYQQQQPQHRPSFSPHHHQFDHRDESDSRSTTSWQVGTPHMHQQLPSYAFAKDRPSLHMDATSEGSASRSRHGLSPFTPPLPSLTSRNLLPAIGGIQARPTPPHVATPSVHATDQAPRVARESRTAFAAVVADGAGRDAQADHATARAPTHVQPWKPELEPFVPIHTPRANGSDLPVARADRQPQSRAGLQPPPGVLPALSVVVSARPRTESNDKRRYCCEDHLKGELTREKETSA